MSIETTHFEIVSTGQEFNIPGDFTAQQIASTYSANIPGIANMQAETTEDGSVRNIVFRPRTGTKG